MVSRDHWKTHGITSDCKLTVGNTIKMGGWLAMASDPAAISVRRFGKVATCHACNEH